MRARLVAALLASFAASAWLVAAAGTAGAHAALEASTPADGAILGSSPERVSLRFTEPTDLALTVVDVVASDGSAVPTAEPEHGANARLVDVTLRDPLADGVYTVTWRTVSTTDTHLTTGSFSFGVGVDPGAVQGGSSGSTSPAPSALAVIGRACLYAGLAIVLGAAAAALAAVGPMAVARPWILVGGWALAAFGTVATTLAERTAVGVPLGTLLSSDAGGAYLRLGVAIVVLGIAVGVAAVRPTRGTVAFLAAAGIAAVIVHVQGGHAAGDPSDVLTQSLHVVGACAWIGGLVWLVVSLRRGLDAPAVRRFSTLSAVGLGVLVLTGVLRASGELGVGWWLDPFRNDYTTTLALKVVVFLPLLALGAVNRYRNVPAFERSGPRPMLRAVSGELGLAALVFGLTGVLTGLPPQASDDARPERPSPLVVTGSDFATTTTVQLRLSPGEVGANAFVAEVLDFDTEEPVNASGVSLRFSFPDRPEVDSRLPLELGSGGTWHAGGTNLSLFGIWEVTALVRAGDGSVEVPLLVTPEAPGQDVAVSSQAGQPDVHSIAIDGGGELQVYVDPGEPGATNQVHVTAFDAGGSELALRSATIRAATSAGPIVSPDVERFGPGHFVANLELTEGTWTFAITATTSDDRVLDAAIEQGF